VKLFLFTGRESGLMVVGSRSALQALATTLTESLAAAPGEPSPSSWPAQVAVASVERGPFRDSKYWQLSLHLEGAAPAEQVVPLHASGRRWWLDLLIFALAIVGLVSLVRGVLSAF